MLYNCQKLGVIAETSAIEGAEVLDRDIFLKVT